MRYIHFPDYDFASNKPPLWINIMRDPIDRYISAWYFNRRGTYDQMKRFLAGTLKNKFFYSKEHYMDSRNITIEEAFDQNKIKQFLFTSLGNVQLNYLCGDSLACIDQSAIVDSDWADVMRRKRDITLHNIEKYYLTIGLVEDFDKFLQLMQWQLPEIFGNETSPFNLLKANQKYGAQCRKQFATYKKPKTVEPRIKDYLRPFFTYEYDVYTYAKARFYVQYSQYEKMYARK